jgi:hypothetical protein
MSAAAINDVQQPRYGSQAMDGEYDGRHLPETAAQTVIHISFILIFRRRFNFSVHDRPACCVRFCAMSVATCLALNRIYEHGDRGSSA